mmetsp:Transcript_26728/g.89485  ORF Transcript_26728/g.89485 Transcript_26728/m.89485 type:complete len:89 (-) Transcript_26728:1058-1324(-)
MDAVWALFVVTTLEGWQEVLYMAVDSRGFQIQPVQRERLGWTWRQDLCAQYPRPDQGEGGWALTPRAPLSPRGPHPTAPCSSSCSSSW